MAAILLIEDDPILRRAYYEILLKGGHTVDQAEDGYLGLRMVETKPYSLVLLDLMMAEMDGLSFLRHLQSNSTPPPVIVFSNVSDDDMIKQAMELGAIRFLAKASVSPKEMISIIEDVLSRHGTMNDTAVTGETNN